MLSFQKSALKPTGMDVSLFIVSQFELLLSPLLFYLKSSSGISLGSRSTFPQQSLPLHLPPCSSLSISFVWCLSQCFSPENLVPFYCLYRSWRTCMLVRSVCQEGSREAEWGPSASRVLTGWKSKRRNEDRALNVGSAVRVNQRLSSPNQMRGKTARSI